MTGPLLAPSGKTLSPGKFTLGSNNFNTQMADHNRNLETLGIVTIGIAEFLDFQAAMPYEYNWRHRCKGQGIGDSTAMLGIQLINSQKFPTLADLRLIIQEVFPTGRIEFSKHKKARVNQTGLGVYQSFVGLNFEKMRPLSLHRLIRTRLALLAVFPGSVETQGYRSVCDKSKVKGRMKVGNSYSVDLAFEYAYQQKIILAIDALYTIRFASNYRGNPEFTPGGSFTEGGNRNELSIAPALEYILNSHLGLTAGVWFSVNATHSTHFVSTVLTLTYQN